MYPTKYSIPLTGLDWLEYYNRHDVYHPGIDFNFGKGMDDLGQDVIAPKSGFVVYIHEQVWASGGFGKFVIIQHADKNYTRYAHLADICVKEGKEVPIGKLIGHLGNTGTTYSHLHFEVFNEKCMQLQLNHWRKFRMYPSGWTKTKVREYYLNPWEWLKGIDVGIGIPAWATAAVTWAKANGIIRNFEGNDMSDYEMALVLQRFHDKFIKK